MSIKVTCPECEWARFREVDELPMLCPDCLECMVERADEGVALKNEETKSDKS